MEKSIHWISRLFSVFREFVKDKTSRSAFHVLDIFEDSNMGRIMAEIKLAGRHVIIKSIGDVVTDWSLLEGFDKKTIRAMTYLATMERLKPDYAIVVQQLGHDVDDYILEIRSRHGKSIGRKTPSELSKDKQELAKFSPIDANRIGYLAGINDTVKEFKMKPHGTG